MPGLRCLLTLLFLLAAFPVSAETDFHFEGAFRQGGLVTGKAPLGTTLRFEGKPLRLSRQGDFVIAFGRNAKPEAVLAYRLADGSEGVRRLAIAKGDFSVERIDGLAPDKVSPNAANLARIRKEGAELAKIRRGDRDEALFANGFAWPVRGRISGVYGSQRILNGTARSPHAGTDIAAAKGTPVRAPADAVVVYRRSDLFFTGQTLVLDHGHGVFSIYAHLDRIDVAEGARVAKGEPIAAIGASGRATAPHLHWGISWFGIPVDPELVAGEMPKPKAP